MQIQDLTSLDITAARDVTGTHYMNGMLCYSYVIDGTTYITSLVNVLPPAVVTDPAPSDPGL